MPFFQLSSFAQDITGIWKGYFISESNEYYKLEFQIKQSNSNTVTGVSYSYLDIRFYGKATMTGNFLTNSSSFRIREIKTVEVKSTLGGATCIMNYNFKYSRSGKEEFLDGTFLSKFEPPYQLNPPGKWGDCGNGKVFLRKVKTSDFYVEPFLRNKTKNVPVIINQAPVKKQTPIIKSETMPAKKPVVTTKPLTTQKPVVVNQPRITKPIINTPSVKKPVIDSAQKTNIPTDKIPPPPIKTPDVLINRTNELVKVLTVIRK
jgi:hypothetical protein